MIHMQLLTDTLSIVNHMFASVYIGTYPSFSFSVENLPIGPHFLVASFRDGLGETFSVSFDLM